MSEPSQVSGAVDRRDFLTGGMAAAAASLIGAGEAAAHTGVPSDGVCATLNGRVSDSSFDATALRGRRFRVELEPGAAQPSGLERGDSIFVQLAHPGHETNAATVGQDGPVRARGVTPLVVGTRADISYRASD